MLRRCTRRVLSLGDEYPPEGKAGRRCLDSLERHFHPLDRYRHPKTRSRLLSVSFFLHFPSIPNRELSRFNRKARVAVPRPVPRTALRKFSLLFRATTGYAGRVMEFVAQVGCTKHRLVKNRLRWITAVPSLPPLYLLPLIPPETATPTVYSSRS